MNRLIRILSFCLLAVAGVASLGLVTSCNITGGSSTGATGRLNVLMTDGPTDDWQQVSVVLKSISLHSSNSDSWKDVWTADPANPAAGTVNIVDLSGVATILQSATIPVGSYNRLRLFIDADPATMTLVTDEGTTIDPANITVVDPSGKGEIKVDLTPAIKVEEGTTANVFVDFDLAHPLSIVNLDGKVVISLRVRHKPLPHRLQTLQFARTLGDITAAADDLTTFTIKTLKEAEVTFNVNANTIYIDADAKAAGSFAGLKALVGSGAALVASNMNSDGSLYARRVWYAADIETLPQFTPEGLVRRVGDSWLSIIKKRTEKLSTGDHHHRCDWNSETVFVNENTTWFFQGNDMGVVGLLGLQYIARGFRVEVTYVDTPDIPKTAASINVQCAHAEGVVANATLESLTLGWFRYSRTMYYSDVTDHTFGWWFYGLDSGRSTDPQAFVDAVDQARTARLWVFAWAGLYWDSGQTRWEVANLVIGPMKLHDFTRITTGYTAASGTMGVSTYDCWNDSVPTEMAIALDTTGDLQTVVGSFVWNAQTNLVTFTLPVLPSEWEALLTPAVDKVKIWVYPVKGSDTNWSWHAYSVITYQFIR